ncbi:putative aquaglyceroporin like protein [Erysiphe necator]|uniref:Putative aquaglyceroporin like protein n=1 Tax=Uncinula necator TaxID=52586 RepID=A0A0B1PBC2_UNCNE|nr:putative aquaglyceroporin like protein [Erysiphe necator]
MVTSSLGDLNTPTRPSIYNENDDIVKKQLRDNSKEHTESNYQRSRSLSSCPVILDKSKKKLQVEPTYAASFPNISSKPILEEVIIEKRAQNNDDNEKSNERNHQKEEPYVFEGGRNYAYNDYTSPYYDRYTRRRIGQRYSSLQHKSPIRHDSLVGNIPKHDEPRSGWSSLSHAFREPLAEFFGVFILVLFGDGYV